MTSRTFRLSVRKRSAGTSFLARRRFVFFRSCLDARPEPRLIRGGRTGSYPVRTAPNYDSTSGVQLWSPVVKKIVGHPEKSRPGVKKGQTEEPAQIPSGFCFLICGGAAQLSDCLSGKTSKRRLALPSPCSLTEGLCAQVYVYVHRCG